MAKEFYVLRASKVVYSPGHYDLEGATRVALIESEQHPRARVKVVKIVDEYEGATTSKDDRDLVQPDRTCGDPDCEICV